jgi:hypothetical protein
MAARLRANWILSGCCRLRFSDPQFFNHIAGQVSVCGDPAIFAGVGQDLLFQPLDKLVFRNISDLADVGQVNLSFVIQAPGQCFGRVIGLQEFLLWIDRSVENIAFDPGFIFLAFERRNDDEAKCRVIQDT